MRHTAEGAEKKTKKKVRIREGRREEEKGVQTERYWHESWCARSGDPEVE